MKTKLTLSITTNETFKTPDLVDIPPVDISLELEAEMTIEELRASYAEVVTSISDLGHMLDMTREARKESRGYMDIKVPVNPEDIPHEPGSDPVDDPSFQNLGSRSGG